MRGLKQKTSRKYQCRLQLKNRLTTFRGITSLKMSVKQSVSQKFCYTLSAPA